MVVWSNWAGNVTAHPISVVAPTSIEELRDIVIQAAKQGLSIRVAGTGHSFAPVCASDGVIIDLVNLAGIESIDPKSGDVTILSGTKIHAIGEPLFTAGRAFANQGDIDRQAIAGAVSTGTHGTGRRFGSFSNAVKAIEILTASGEIVTIDETSSEIERRAAALSLGMFGVVTKLRLSTVPAYKLREKTVPVSFDECMATYDQIERQNRNAEFWWVPPLDTCVLKTFTETQEEILIPDEIEHPPGTLARYLKDDKVDWSYRVYPSSRTFRFVECEHTIPIENGPAAVTAIREMMQTRHSDVKWAVEYRTLAAETHLLSPTQGEDSATISVHHAADAEWKPFMRDADALFRSFGGRPHWGKLHWMTRADVDALYADADAFRDLRSAFDPDGLFLNGHLREFFG